MGETLFSINRHNFRDCQSRYRGEQDQEYYSGDFWIEDASQINVRSERTAIGAISIILQRSATNLFFRRTRKHIREDATDLSILWFVKHGQIVVSNQLGTTVITPGEFAVSRSISPFLMECRVDNDDVHEVLHVTIPTHMLRDYALLGDDALTVLPRQAELAIAENILTDLFEGAEALDPNSSSTLTDAALKLIGTAIETQVDRPHRQTITELRQEAVLRFIDLHLSNPMLSTAMVSNGCGISIRYLSWLLRSKGTSFSKLVWTQRLEKARRLLGNGGMEVQSIAEICYSLGFKSSAHFSRMFKRTYKTSPRDYRANSLQHSEHQPAFPERQHGELLQ
ncbi:MAG: AraC family transcriptional regulator [Hyphomicrobiales bacterium]|nr:MAG: AraC family transcriptional regulator [Hyphomicrobiales bacterium]